MDSYSAVHRKHMARELEHQNNEWRKLNVRHEDWLDDILNVIGWACALTAIPCFVSLIVHWWPK